ncbi:hypothetical protein [Erythrobacter crassostreae]|uniref:Uncharacterized protein n=1 Tax=Erythrobacter crassostreae TaxID=2828328 RepID=A0A9X1F4E3_9SPHN|nr:hypothetical protein [Erythrobacter crassostrea]MBV7260040.1 hypothetical protein [Erythrobacter crassostrea]
MSSSICDLPENRQFWQGKVVDWQSQIIEVESGHHGGFVAFSEYDCGNMIGIDKDKVGQLFTDGDPFDGYMVVADFRVQGRIIFGEGQMLLSPSIISRESDWKNEDSIGPESHFGRLYEAVQRPD